MARLKKNYSESIKLLGLNPGASPEEIKIAYRKLAKQYHPDVYKLDGGEKFKELSSAYYFLKKHPDPPIKNETQTHYANPQSDYGKRRRAYHKRQKEKKAKDAAQKEEMFKWLFARVRIIALIILIFNSLLLIDYILPSVSEEVKIDKIKTVRTTTKYQSTSSEKSYKIELENGISFRLGKQNIGEIDINDVFVLKRSRVFQEAEFIKNITNDTIIYNEYGLFRIFGFLIPVSFSLIIAYLNFVKNNDYRLTIFLISLIIFVFQLILVF